MSRSIDIKLSKVYFDKFYYDTSSDHYQFFHQANMVFSVLFLIKLQMLFVGYYFYVKRILNNKQGLG